MREKILLAGHWKSGNTWLGHVLSYLLNCEYVEPYNYINGVKINNQRILELTSGEAENVRKSQYKSIIKTHAWPATQHMLNRHDLLTEKRILIIRDPRDAAISYYHFIRLYPETRRTGIGRLWTTNMYKYFRRWRRYMTAWLKEETYHVRFEDLKSDGVGTIRGICEYLNVERTEDEIEEALAQFSIHKLKEQSSDEYTKKFYRSGQTGEHNKRMNWLDRLMFRWILGTFTKQFDYR